jgi:putative tryptophan/tyrosine transport system substrate-binding protein
MRRREFIGLLGSTAAAWTCGDVFAAQKSPIARLGFLSMSMLPRPAVECKSSRPDEYQDPTCWLAYDLNALGWREGENMQLEIRYGTGDPASLPRLAAELVTLRPDVLIAVSSDETKALQAVTSDIPIVFISSSDRLAMVS